MSTLNAHERDALKDSDFALSGRRYPIHDEAHARDALARVAANGTPEDIAEVRKKVHARYPSLAGDGDEKKPLAAGASPLTGLMLESGGEFQPVLTLGQEQKRDDQGRVRLRYWKEMLTPGGFADAKKNEWKFPPERIGEVLDENKRAFALGHKPLIQDDHFKPTKTYGEIEDARINGNGGLEWLHSFYGTAERDEAIGKRVSIMLIPNYTDARGRTFKWWPEHSASVFRPQLPDLKNFTPALAASNGQAVDAVALSPIEPQAQGDSMPDFSKLRAAIGNEATGKSDDDLLALAATAITASNDTRTKLRATLGTAAEGKPDGDLIALCADQIEANGVLARELTAAEQKVTEATEKLALAAEPPVEHKPDPQVLALSAKLAEKDVELAETKKQITPKQAIYLRERIKSGSALVLSADTTGKTPIDDLIAFAALAEGHIPPNKPVGSVPVQKALALANDSAVTEGPMTPERKKELMALAGYTA